MLLRQGALNYLLRNRDEYASRECSDAVSTVLLGFRR
jgi:hypothetical protein